MVIDYSKKVIELFRNPKNAGEIENPTVKSTTGDLTCGDAITFYFKIKDGKIKDVKFKSYGCAANIAAASILTEMIKDKTVKEAKKITWEDINEELEGLPPIKHHCSNLAMKALKKGLKKYEKKKKPEEET